MTLKARGRGDGDLKARVRAYVTDPLNKRLL